MHYVVFAVIILIVVARQKILVLLAGLFQKNHGRLPGAQYL
jgi:hypothetical protein